MNRIANNHRHTDKNGPRASCAVTEPCALVFATKVGTRLNRHNLTKRSDRSSRRRGYEDEVPRHPPHLCDPTAMRGSEERGARFAGLSSIRNLLVSKLFRLRLCSPR